MSAPSHIDASAEQLPVLDKNTLVELGGWTAFKQAKNLNLSGAVHKCNWNYPMLKGEVGSGPNRFFPSLNLRSTLFAESKCNCSSGRKGYVCEHALALCIHIESQKTREDTASFDESNAVKPGSSGEGFLVKSLVLSEDKGIPLSFEIILPPNLQHAASKDAIIVKVEAIVDETDRVAPEDIDRGRSYWLSTPYYRLASLIEDWCDGRLFGMLQLTRSRLSSLLNILEGESSIYWVHSRDKPLVWGGNELEGVHSHLTQRPPSKPISVKPKVSSRRTPSKLNDGVLSAEVDGSMKYLSIALPSRESYTYNELLNLLKLNGFRLDPRTRRWWLRDSHKVLNFLARNWRELEGRHYAQMTKNFKKQTENLEFAKVQTRGEQKGEGFYLELKLDAGIATEFDIREAIASGRFYVKSGKMTYLLDPVGIACLEQVQRSLSGEPKRSFSPVYRRQVDPAELPDVESLVEPIAGPIESPDVWKERSRALKELDNLPHPPLSKGFDDQLRPYQRIGVAWLWHLYCNRLGGVLADEMGLGKTIQALGLIDCIFKEVNQLGEGPVVVVCPASLVENWRREATRFVPHLPVFVHHGTDRLASPESFKNYSIIITSYGTLTRDHSLFEQVQLGTIIADEAQHIKNNKTRNAQALKQLNSFGRFILTGTPLENSLDDLRSLFDFVMPGYLSPIVRGADRSDRAWFDARHRTQASPYILRRSKQQVAPELPEKIEQIIFCPQRDNQKALYQSVLEKTRREIFELEMSGASENKVRFAAFTQLLRLRQVCADPRILDPQMTAWDSGKLRALREIIDEAIDGNHRMLIFSQFVSVLQLLREELEKSGTSYCYLDGNTKNRQDECDRFNNDNSIPVFLISLKAGGQGLNLTGADMVVHYDPWWNPAVEAQATDRAHRIGQTRTVTSIKLIAADTIEEKVLSMQRTKERLLKDLFESSEAANAKIGLKDLKALLDCSGENN